MSLFSEFIFVRDRRHQVPRPGTTVTGTLGDPGDLGPMAFFSVVLNQWCGFIDTGHPMKPKLVGGFHPFEKQYSNWIIAPNSDEKNNI